jgi:VTC domain-containing protein
VENIRELFEALRPVSLDEMNERAALQRRTDNTYLVPLDALVSLVEDVGDGHEVLEIDGERLFDYESTYFDTPSLECFHDHVRDRRPRYKARTRCYVTTGDCFFEVKVKQEDGETAKRNVEYDPDERGRIEPVARDLLDDVLPACGLGERARDLEPSLITRFRRATVVARDGPERTTFDFSVSLGVPHGDVVGLGGQFAIAETKTPDGSGAWDLAFADAGFEPVSFSKYRAGTGLLRAPGEDDDYTRDIKKLLRPTAPSR